MHRLPKAWDGRGKTFGDFKTEVAEYLGLVGASEIAERAGVHRSTINKWTERYSDFPAPVAELAQGNVWAWPEIEAFIEAHRLARGRGRPKSSGGQRNRG